ncbi:carbohydrate ABC transporter permease [Plantibacter sp. MMLR14_011]|uniref:carbohydrate ABC transporter permease n=1 Tax=unclassified Plantibacter TaxID=2624265 RepID=UPI0008DC5E91|nr:carbohydrate ABC transporter permease [Plantibacter sp. MMLR14_011]OII43593.1 ABC transporter permease [Plantibacter sp. MMLR14_011]
MTDQQLAVRGPRRRHRGRTLGFVANSTIAWLFALVFSFPLIWTFFTALKPANEVFGARITFIGSEVLWSNFADAWVEVDFGRLLTNSLVVAAVSTLLTLIVATLTAFAFARLRFPGRSAVFVLFIITLTLPAEVAVVPLFLGFDQVRLADTWIALILPGLFGAFGAFLLRQFMLQIPAELEEAARLDGASTWRILTSVIVPLVRPAISVLAIFSFLGSWNSFLWPLIILNSSDKWTIPIGIAGFTTQTGTQWELLMAACVMTIAPVVVVVAVAQRQLVAAIGAGAFGGR